MEQAKKRYTRKFQMMESDRTGRRLRSLGGSSGARQGKPSRRFRAENLPTEAAGWAMGNYTRTELMLAAINMAGTMPRAQSAIRHSDHGCKYDSYAFGQRPVFPVEKSAAILIAKGASSPTVWHDADAVRAHVHV
jgi:hypothetical protein